MSELIYVPRGETPSKDGYIPALYLPYMSGGKGSQKILLYFHGNAEDIGISYQMLDHLRSMLHLNIMAMEYPGYGAYKLEESADEARILTDAEFTYKYILKQTSVLEEDIIVMGRSLGSGPATHLCSKFSPGALVLMSPFVSIKSVANNKVGFLSFLLADMFDNLSKMPMVECPTFIVHGQKDSLIPVSQA